MPRKRISAKNFNTVIETPKRIRTSLTGLQKKEICQIKLKNPSYTNAEIAELFGCGTSTIGDVIRESGKWLAINEDDHAAQLRKNRQSKWPALEQAMTIWLERLFLANQDIDGSAIQNGFNEEMQESTLLQNLIDRLPYGEKLTAEGMFKEISLYESLKEYYLTLSLLEFIEIDNNIPIEDLVNDQEIIDLVLQEDSESSDTNEEVDILKSISYSEAHSAIQTTLMFLEQNRNDSINVDRDDLLLLRLLLRDIEKEKINHLKQTQLNWHRIEIIMSEFIV